MPEVRSKIRLKDIAESADLSVSAVSMALADHPSISSETKSRIRHLAQEMGYRPGSRSGPRPRSGDDTRPTRLGFISVGRTWSRPQDAELLQAFSLAAKEHNARVEFDSVAQADTATVARDILSFARELDGVLITDLVRPDVLRRIALAGVSFVVFGNVIEEDGGPGLDVGHFIGGDDLRMARESTHLLRRRGHRRIGFVCEELTPGLSHWRWLAGYRLALAEAPQPIDPKLVFVTGEIEAGEDRAAQYFTEMPDAPTAWVIPDGRIASTFIREMGARGQSLDPRNVAIECGEQTAAMFGIAPCPACHLDPTRIATVAIHQLLDLMERPLDFSTETLVPFVTRNWDAPAG